VKPRLLSLRDQLLELRLLADRVEVGILGGIGANPVVQIDREPEVVDRIVDALESTGPYSQPALAAEMRRVVE
jgi:hypothetical protein